MVRAGTQHQLEQLLESRYHGAANINGIKFQITYSLLRAFDLYDPVAPTSIHLEGIEDVDIKGRRKVTLRGFKIYDEYVQVKTSKADWDWSRFINSKILDNFLPLYSTNPSASLLVVTNFNYIGRLSELVKFCNGTHAVLSNKIKADVISICKRLGYQKLEPVKLLKHIRFERISDKELEDRITIALTRSFNLTTPNSDIYLLVLVSRFLELAAHRGEIKRDDLEHIRLFVQEQIQLGVTNLAVQNGWVERLNFTPEENPEDYYEGKNARPGHILAALDVQRPEWNDRIYEVLNRSYVCVLRTASGQGKSTLLYRYAYEHYHPETTLIVKHLGDESMVGAIKQVILTRQGLGLPILVLIDNVRANLRYWHRLAAAFAGQDVRFLITVREEDWFRYSGATSDFVWEVVTPTLSLQEARGIYTALKKKNRVASNVSSAEWAFEQVAERQLLIEFTYLLTHGQMLAERLEEQVREMQITPGEDKAKLHILRLLSVAQSYEAKVAVAALLSHVQFDQDPAAILESLHGEYLICIDGLCEGLHYVRSQHLAGLLHRIVPLEHTIIELIHILDPENLESFISSVFADSEVNHEVLSGALAKRCGGEAFDLINRVAKALFTASEALYFREHQSLFDKAVEEFGTSTILLLSMATMPFPAEDLLESLVSILGEKNSDIKALSDFPKQFAPRQWNKRYEVKFLQNIINTIDADVMRADFQNIGTFFGWCRLTGINTSHLINLLVKQNWREHIYEADLDAIANFLEALHDHSRETYDSFLASEKATLFSLFKLLSDTLKVEERERDIYIEFIVDESEGYARSADQASNRLQQLRNFFPDYERYCSQGLYPLEHELERIVDDTHKEIANETLKWPIDAEKNAAYVSIVEEHYAARSVFDWQEQWFIFRSEFLAFVKAIINMYSALFRQQKTNLDTVNSMWRNLRMQNQQMKKLPSPFRKKLAKEQGNIDRWSLSLGNFLRQMSEPTQESRRLMRYNFKDSIVRLPEMQAGFEKISSETQRYFDQSTLVTEESEKCTYLADILDIWFDDPPQNAVHDLRRFIEKYRRSRRQQFADAVHSTLAPLEEHGFTFIYPNGPLVNHQFIELCVGFNVLDFEEVKTQMGIIIAQLAEFPLEYHFLYLLPLLHGQRYTSRIWRISSHHISELVKGNLQDKQWTLLPVELPQELFTVLSQIEETTIIELGLLNDFYRLYTEFNYLRNSIFFVQSNINADQPFEVQLAEKYQDRLQQRANVASEEYSLWVDRMLHMADESVAQTEWVEFCRCCFERLQGFGGTLRIDIDSFQVIRVWEDLEPESLFHRYLNAKYMI